MSDVVMGLNDTITQPWHTIKTIFNKEFPKKKGILLKKKRRKGKHKKKKRGGTSKDTKSLYYSKKAKQPWLLVSHLPNQINKPKKIVRLYKFRMQIEEGFRDTKNQQYGIGLAQAKSKSEKRYNNLLLVAALTQLILWCIGKIAVEKKYHYDLQANTIRHRTMLSNVNIGIQIIRDKRYKIKKKEIKMIFENGCFFNLTIIWLTLLK